MVNLWANSVVGLQLSAADLALNRAMEQVLTTTGYQVPGGMLAKGPVQTEKAPQGIEEPDAQGETGGILNLPFEGKTNGTKLIKGQNGTYEVLEELKGGGEARIYFVPLVFP